MLTLHQGAANAQKSFADFTTMALLMNETLSDSFLASDMAIFVFTNDVFDALPHGSLDFVNMTELILNHVVLGDPLTPETLRPSSAILTAAGNRYIVQDSELGYAKIGGFDILPITLKGLNGFAYIIQGILMPP